MSRHRAPLAVSLLLVALCVTGCVEDDRPATGTPGGAQTLELPSTGEVATWTIGLSVQGRPLVLERFGDSGPPVLVMSAIHGNERPAVLLGERLRMALLGGLAEAAGVQVLLLEAANPDGVAAISRANANGVDLNRNFPSKNFDPSSEHGFAPLSEPESQALATLLEDLDPVGIVTVHTPLDMVDYNGPAQALAKAMAETSGIPLETPLGGLPGSLGSWAGDDMGIPIITLELPPAVAGLAGLVPGQDAVKVLLAWAAAGKLGPTTLDAPFVPATSVASPLEGWVLGRSAGGLPIRAERFGASDARPVLVVGGLSGASPTALFVAERVRTFVLSRKASALPSPMLLVTVASPDAVQSGEATNANGVEIARSFPSDATSEPEVTALMGLLEAAAPIGVVLVSGADEPWVGAAGPGAGDVGDALEGLGFTYRVPELPEGSLERVATETLGIPVTILGVGPQVQAEDTAEAWRRAALAAAAAFPGD